MNTYNIFNAKVLFSEEELNIMENAGIDTQNNFSDFIELILLYSGIQSFSEELSADEIHDICIDSLKEHEKIVKKTIFGLGLDNKHIENTIKTETVSEEKVDVDHDE